MPTAPASAKSTSVLRIQSQGAAQQFGVLALSLRFRLRNPHHSSSSASTSSTAPPSIRRPPMPSTCPPPSPAKRPSTATSKKNTSPSVPSPSVTRSSTISSSPSTNRKLPASSGARTTSPRPAPSSSLLKPSPSKLPPINTSRSGAPTTPPPSPVHDGLQTWTWKSSQLVPAPKATSEEHQTHAAAKIPTRTPTAASFPPPHGPPSTTGLKSATGTAPSPSIRPQPTDALRARADDLTKDAKTPDDQIRAIYDFVSTKTRYIGIDFGIGRYQPHSAAEVLANQYGDCKDKDTLLEALLRAKGFSTAPALIGAGIAPVPELPSPAVFNHVITTVNLPTGRIWLDSTPPAAPYRFLSAVIRDQKALVIPATTPARWPRPPPLVRGPTPSTSKPTVPSTPTANSPAKSSPAIATTPKSSSAPSPWASRPPSGTRPPSTSPP